MIVFLITITYGKGPAVFHHTRTVVRSDTLPGSTFNISHLFPNHLEIFEYKLESEIAFKYHSE